MLTQTEASNLFRRPPERWLDLGDGAAAAYRRVGEGPDVLFVHGWPVSGATFRRLLPHLADHVTCHLIDLPGAGESRFDSPDTLTIARHIAGVRAVVDVLGLTDLAVVGHDSGGLIARHALAGDERVRAMGLIDTEPPTVRWRFRSFIRLGTVPQGDRLLRWMIGSPRVRRNKFALGDAFADPGHLDGEFDEFFLRPLRDVPARLAAAMSVLRSFDLRYVDELDAVHRRIGVPVTLVWGERDAFFPLADARAMADTYDDTSLSVIPDAGLFSHEERPSEVAAALLPALVAARPPR